MDGECLNSALCIAAHMRAAGGGGGAALLMSETAALCLPPAACLLLLSLLPSVCSPLLRGGRVQAVYVTRRNFAGRGVWRRGGVCAKGETLTLEERLGLGACWGPPRVGQPGFSSTPVHRYGQESAVV